VSYCFVLACPKKFILGRSIWRVLSVWPDMLWKSDQKVPKITQHPAPHIIFLGYLHNWLHHEKLKSDKRFKYSPHLPCYARIISLVIVFSPNGEISSNLAALAVILMDGFRNNGTEAWSCHGRRINHKLLSNLTAKHSILTYLHKFILNYLPRRQGDQVSMLWSQFSAIFANFWRKIGGFLKNPCYDENFA
jgi:hypothetical protein